MIKIICIIYSTSVFPILSSVTSKIGHGGSISTTEIKKHDTRGF